MESMNSKKIADKFKSLFKTEAHVFRSPGRINLIGEHTDYNDGYVFPFPSFHDVCLVPGL